MNVFSLGALLGCLLFAAPQESEIDWLTRGRALLDQGKAAEAQLVFEEARELAVSDSEPRIWVVRSWLAQGRVNDSLDAIDELAAEGISGAPIHYLYGMSWFLAAEAKLKSGGAGTSLRRNILDAIHHLQLATEEHHDRYRDALRPLAKMAWMNQRLDLAAPAADLASGYYPADARIAHLQGRIAHEQFTIAIAEPDGAERASSLAEKSTGAYRRTTVLIGVPVDAIGKVLLAETWVQLGRLYFTLGDERAVEALANAVSSKPDHLDYRELSTVIAPDLFIQSVELGLAKFEERARHQPESGGAYWWLGYTAFRSNQLERAERAFVAALASKSEAVESAWYYLGRLRYVQRNFSGAISALRSSWERNPAALFSSLDIDKQFNIAMLDSLAGWCVRQRRTIDATIFYELSAEFTQSAEAWQKLGLFLISEGERLYAEHGPEFPLARRSHLTALAAFQRALEIEPRSPLYLLSTARHLHRTLKIEPDRALELYGKARLEAGRLLADSKLPVERSSELRAIRSEARRSIDELLQDQPR